MYLIFRWSYKNLSQSEWVRYSSREKLNKKEVSHVDEVDELINRLHKSAEPQEEKRWRSEEVKVRISDIEKALNRERFGAKFELQNIIDDVGEENALILVQDFKFCNLTPNAARFFYFLNS